MNKQTKTILGIGSLIVTGLGTTITTTILIKRSKRIEIEKQLLVEGVRRFMRVNKAGLYDLRTDNYISGLILGGRKLTSKQREEIIDRAKLAR